jgi:thiamine pyrophosphate-dependent acetolactate synthase large subunit-like protein
MSNLTPTHGGQLFAHAIKAHGVEHVFTLTGGHIAPILIGCKQVGIRVIDVRDEATTVFAADAVARLTGKFFFPAHRFASMHLLLIAVGFLYKLE